MATSTIKILLIPPDGADLYEEVRVIYVYHMSLDDQNRTLQEHMYYKSYHFLIMKSNDYTKPNKVSNLYLIKINKLMKILLLYRFY